MFIYYKSGLRELNQEIEGIGAVYTQNLSFYSICKYYNIELIHHIHHLVDLITIQIKEQIVLL